MMKTKAHTYRWERGGLVFEIRQTLGSAVSTTEHYVDGEQVTLAGFLERNRELRLSEMPSWAGCAHCECGSIASGGVKTSCTCDRCF